MTRPIRLRLARLAVVQAVATVFIVGGAVSLAVRGSIAGAAVLGLLALVPGTVSVILALIVVGRVRLPDHSRPWR